MIHRTAEDWLVSKHKRIALFGMSGLGKTHVSNLMRASGQWFHYSVDYRIGTRYMGEHIVDNFKREAMRTPFLRELLMSDSIFIGSNITFNNLTPLSTYLGKPGDPAKGGLPFEEYMRRQDLHRQAEIAALTDTPHFIDRAQDIYGYPHFVCDSGGSICEVVDPNDAGDPVLNAIASRALLVWIKGSDAHTDTLIQRFNRVPKPMYYQPAFLRTAWDDYLSQTGVAGDRVDPDAFVRWIYARALSVRQPRYVAMAANWGLTITAEDVARVAAPDDFVALVARALEARAASA